MRRKAEPSLLIPMVCTGADWGALAGGGTASFQARGHPIPPPAAPALPLPFPSLIN